MSKIASAAGSGLIRSEECSTAGLLAGRFLKGVSGGKGKERKGRNTVMDACTIPPSSQYAVLIHFSFPHTTPFLSPLISPLQTNHYSAAQHILHVLRLSSSGNGSQACPLFLPSAMLLLSFREDFHFQGCLCLCCLL